MQTSGFIIAADVDRVWRISNICIPVIDLTSELFYPARYYL